MQTQHEILFTPVRIGAVDIKNRYAMAPMGPAGFSDADGTFNPRGIDYYVERARGGTGLIITGVSIVENDIEHHEMPFMPCPTINPGNFVKTARDMTERVHAYDSRIFLQLTAGFGRVGIPHVGAGATAIAPSAIPHRWVDGVTCRPMTIEEIHAIVGKFADSAEIARNAGFDGIEVHAVHEGYLLDQFAIAFFNQRTDEYGGSLENRLRFACEIVQAIKARCGSDFPVALRYSLKSFIKDWRKGALPGEAFEEKGRDVEEGLVAAKLLEAAGYDAFDGDLGCYDAWYWNHPPMYQAKGLYLPYNAMLKQALKVPVITAGRMDNPDLAAAAVAEGKTDMVGLGRPLLADPALPQKIQAGRAETVRPCLSCQEGCMGRIAAGWDLSCAVNPASGHERDYALQPALRRKSVMMAGGGIAGMEAARVAALRGHAVTIYESSDRLGGVVIPGGAPDFKEDDRALIAWYERELEDLAVPVKFNAPVSAALVEAKKPDVLIVATGGRPKMPRLGDAGNVCTAVEALNGVKPIGKRAIVIGGGLVGCETALWLREQGHEVTIVEIADRVLGVAGPLCFANSSMLLDLLTFKQVRVMTSSRVVEPGRDGFVVETGDKRVTVPADTAIVAIGYASDRSLYEQTRNRVREIYLLGDARKVQNIMYAIWEAYEVARGL
jgi:2-enoate reductase